MAIVTYHLQSNMHVKSRRRSQDFVWGALFFARKVDDLFLVIALKTHAKTT